MISFDDGTTINQIAGTSVGKVVTLDTGVTDLGKSIYYEIIDRWRSFTNMYANSKAISGMNVFTENAGGMSVDYQTEKSPVNESSKVECHEIKFNPSALNNGKVILTPPHYSVIEGKDLIARSSESYKVDEFRGAMRFNIEKYIDRLGKKDSLVKELRKIADYANRWADYEEKLQGSK